MSTKLKDIAMSGSNYYNLFIDNCIQLASTIIIKSQDAVDGLNAYVHDQYLLNGTQNVDLFEPTTFKYYLNISGQYHHLDTMMRVISIDTLQVMDFTLDNLALNPATANAYKYGTRQYQVLLNQYPDQELLIKGILYPVNINVAIAAADGTILGYPPNLVEVNEYSLISNLQKFINGFKNRWTNIQYGISDVLYPATSLGIMYLNLLPAILTYRLQACRTNEAHSFHVRQYLASHNLLNSYIDSMTLDQTLFFYRNIAYIERNSGKQAIFNWLIYNIMTVRNLPITEYEMHHDLTNQPTKLYPNVVFYKKPINNKISLASKNNLSIQDTLVKEESLTTNNLKYLNDYLPLIQNSMENSQSNILRTKILESDILDESNSGPYSLPEILLNNWIFLSTSNLYIAYITVTNPKNTNLITLSVKDAYTLAWYVLCNSIGIKPVTIPAVLATRVPRVIPVNNNGVITTVPTVSEIMSVVDSTIVDPAIATLALSMQPNVTQVISTVAFYKLCKELYNSAQMQRNLIANQQLAVERAMVFNMVSRIYSDNICTLEPDNTLYADWLNNVNIDISNLDVKNLNDLYTNLITAATGSDLFITTSIKDIQMSMINIMTQLSSYSVQFIDTINIGVDTKTDWTVVRFDNLVFSENVYRVLDLGAFILDINGSSTNDFDYVLDDGGIVISANTKSALYISNINNVDQLVLNYKPINIINYDTNKVGVMDIEIVTGVNTIPVVDIYGYDDNATVKPIGVTNKFSIPETIVVPNITLIETINSDTNINIGGYPTDYDLNI